MGALLVWSFVLGAVALGGEDRRPKHPIWTSSLGGVANVAFGTGRGGVRTEHSLLLPQFLQGHADFALFQAAFEPDLAELPRVGHLSAGIHIPFLVRHKKPVEAIVHNDWSVWWVAETELRRYSYHSFGVLVGESAQSNLGTRPNASALRVVATGTHVLVPIWVNQQRLTPGAAKTKAVVSWQLGALIGGQGEGSGRVVEVALSAGPIRGAVAHQSGHAGNFTMVELGLQLLIAKDVAFKLED